MGESFSPDVRSGRSTASLLPIIPKIMFGPSMAPLEVCSGVIQWLKTRCGKPKLYGSEHSQLATPDQEVCRSCSNTRAVKRMEQQSSRTKGAWRAVYGVRLKLQCCPACMQDRTFFSPQIIAATGFAEGSLRSHRLANESIRVRCEHLVTRNSGTTYVGAGGLFGD